MFLAVTAETCPRHGFQSRFGDGTLAGLTYAESTVLDPSQCVFDCAQQVTVTLVQMDLESSLDLLGRPIGGVPSMTLRSACGQQGSECGSRPLLPRSTSNSTFSPSFRV